MQGQVVDRIDHNIENTSLKVEAGLNELKKADQYQKKNRKMKCIVIEAVIVVVLLFILIVFKTWKSQKTVKLYAKSLRFKDTHVYFRILLFEPYLIVVIIYMNEK